MDTAPASRPPSRDVATRDIIVMGGSSGAVETLTAIAATLPANLPAAIFLVVHVPARVRSRMPEILSRAGPLPALHPEDGEAIVRGRIYVAPPDFHLMVDPGRMRVVRGPSENNHRPAIDPLFRSAAVAYGPRVIAVVLSGALDDGSAGLIAVRRRGGIAVVQEPGDALFPDMPRNALLAVRPDHCVTKHEMGSLLGRLARETMQTTPPRPPPAQDMEQEIAVEALSMEAVQNEDRPGRPSSFACPDCGGVLWEIDDQDMVRFRCRVGHACGVQGLVAAQVDAVDDALWSAFRALQENASLSRRIAARARQNGNENVARNFEDRAKATERQSGLLRHLLLNAKAVTGAAERSEEHQG